MELQSIKNLMNESPKGQSVCKTEYEQRKCDFFNNRIGELKGYDCWICNNKGQIAVMQNERMVLKACECQAIRRSQYLLKKSGLMELVQRYSFETYKVTNDWQKSIHDCAKRFVDDKEHWFFIGGQVGTGKTHICTAIASSLILKGNEVYYFLYRDEIVKLKNIINDIEYSQTVKHFKDVAFLYIDDLFKTEKGKAPTTADIQIIFEILNHRYNSEKPTIISSEKTINELVAIDEAIGSRIYEMASKNLLEIQPDINKNMRFNTK